MVNTDFVYDFDSEKINKASSHKYFSDRKLGFKVYENAYVVPGCGVYDKDGNFVDGTYIHSNHSEVPKTFDGNFQSVDDETVYVGFHYYVWGHCLTDCVSRFWIFSKDNEENAIFKNKKYVYASLKNQQFGANYKEFLKCAEIDYSKFEMIKTATRFKSVIVPDRSFDIGEDGYRYYTKEYAELIESVKSKAKVRNDGKYDKVYISTLRYMKPWRIMGEKKYEDFFKKQGYTIIYPEEHSFSEQLEIFYNCKKFVSPEGSCSHNLIFMKDAEESEAIILRRSNYFTGYQMAVNELIGKGRVSYVDSHLSVFSMAGKPWLGPCYYFVSENLLNYFGLKKDFYKNYYLYNFKDFKKYIKVAKNRDTLLYNNSTKELDLYATELLKNYKKQTVANRIKNFVKKILKRK